MWTATEDRSVVDAHGRVILFSAERFIKDIAFGDCCFICGAAPGSRTFNNEHIIPEWLLRRYGLFSTTITLANGAAVRYDRYTVPCCADCNSLMGDVIETPISEVVRGGADSIYQFLKTGHLLKLYVWMALIYLKTHLKDQAMRFHLDSRKGDQRIADMYEWEDLHHIHSIVRCFYTECTVEREAIGSFLCIPFKAQASLEKFDYGDLTLAQSMMLRLDNVALLAVFNDSGGALSYFDQKLTKVTGPISELQLREIMVELAYLNLHLKERPTFHTEINLRDETYRIVGTRPELELMTLDRKIRGELLHHAVRHVLPHISIMGRTNAEVVEAIKAGSFTFLFNDNGEFISESWRPLD